jgi:hypothetical protein
MPKENTSSTFDEGENPENLEKELQVRHRAPAEHERAVHEKSPGKIIPKGFKTGAPPECSGNLSNEIRASA